MPLMLDLCCGLKGVSQVFSDNGWDVLTLDNDASFNPDIITDIRQWSYTGVIPDFVWASPPCTEFARESMPWCKRGIAPDMSIILACMRIIRESQPQYWIIENVRGAAKCLGKPDKLIFPYYLWGVFPDFIKPVMNKRKKESYWSSDRALRAKIPYELSLAVMNALGVK